jgi:hypothetical protein
MTKGQMDTILPDSTLLNPVILAQLRKEQGPGNSRHDGYNLPEWKFRVGNAF